MQVHCCFVYSRNKGGTQAWVAAHGPDAIFNAIAEPVAQGVALD